MLQIQVNYRLAEAESISRGAGNGGFAAHPSLRTPAPAQLLARYHVHPSSLRSPGQAKLLGHPSRRRPAPQLQTALAQRRSRTLCGRRRRVVRHRGSCLSHPPQTSACSARDLRPRTPAPAAPESYRFPPPSSGVRGGSRGGWRQPLVPGVRYRPAARAGAGCRPLLARRRGPRVSAGAARVAAAVAGEKGSEGEARSATGVSVPLALPKASLLKSPNLPAPVQHRLKLRSRITNTC